MAFDIVRVAYHPGPVYGVSPLSRGSGPSVGASDRRPGPAVSSSVPRRDSSQDSEVQFPKKIRITKVMVVFKKVNQTIIFLPTVGANSARAVIAAISTLLTLSPKGNIIFTRSKPLSS